MEGTGCQPISPCPTCISCSQEEIQALHYLAALPGVQLGHLIITSYNLQLPLFFMTLISLLLSGHILEENYYLLNRIGKAQPVCLNIMYLFFSLVSPVYMPSSYILEVLVC